MKDPIHYTCPRCGTDTVTIHYGPCRACVDELQAWATEEGDKIKAKALKMKEKK